MRPLKIAAIVVGALLILVGLGLLVPGAFLLWAHESQRDEAGFYETSPQAVATDTYALISPDFNVELGGAGDLIPEGWAGTVRMRALSSDKELFVGIGPSDRVEAYLSGVAHEKVESFSAWGARLDYQRVPGNATPAPPGEQDFWRIAMVGSDPQPLEWEVDSGEWTAVIMNADASPGVQADLSLGARIDFLLPIAVGLLVAGVVLLIIGIVLVILGARRSRPEPSLAGPYGAYPPGGYGPSEPPPGPYDPATPQPGEYGGHRPDRNWAQYPPVDKLDEPTPRPPSQAYPPNPADVPPEKPQR